MKANLAKVAAGMLLLPATIQLVAAPRNGGVLMQAFPSHAQVVNGGPAAHYMVVVTSQGYSGRVALSCEPTSPGISCSVTPAIANVDGESAVRAIVTARAASDTRPASYPLVITGSGDSAGTLRNITVILQVEPRPN